MNFDHLSTKIQGDGDGKCQRNIQSGTQTESAPAELLRTLAAKEKKNNT